MAKALFLLAFIQVSSVAADAAILAARGFQPMRYLPQLLLKQLVLAVALTPPAAALATVTGNLPQFVFAGVVIAVLGLFSVTRVEQFSPWVNVDQVRRAIVLLALTSFAAVIVYFQYSRRWTAPSRAIGLAAILIAGTLFAYLPRSYTFALGCELARKPADGRAFSVRLASRNEPAPHDRYPHNFEQVRIPVVISGIPEHAEVEFDQLAFDIIGPHGESWKMNRSPAIERGGPGSVNSWLWMQHPNGEGWQSLILGRSVYERVKALNVSLISEVAVRLYRGEKPVWMPVSRTTESAVPGLGHCSTALDENRGEEMLDVSCESPTEISPHVKVRLVDLSTGRVWNQQLRDSMGFMSYPVRTWLSPLNRRQTFFHLVGEVRNEAEMSWLVPCSVLSSANVGFVPPREQALVVQLEQSPYCWLRDLQLPNPRCETGKFRP